MFARHSVIKAKIYQILFLASTKRRIKCCRLKMSVPPWSVSSIEPPFHLHHGVICDIQGGKFRTWFCMATPTFFHDWSHF